MYYLQMLNLKRDKHLSQTVQSGDKKSDLLVNLIKNKPDINDEELASWAKWMHMPLDLVKKFRDYQYVKKVQDVPGAMDIPPGRNLGDYVKGYNTWKAMQTIGKMPRFKEWLSLVDEFNSI
jgi:hypothetical protein